MSTSLHLYIFLVWGLCDGVRFFGHGDAFCGLSDERGRFSVSVYRFSAALFDTVFGELPWLLIRYSSPELRNGTSPLGDRQR